MSSNRPLDLIYTMCLLLATLVSSTEARRQDCPEDILQYASDSLQERSTQLIAHAKGREDGTLPYELAALACAILPGSGQDSLIVALVGLAGLGEILLLERSRSDSLRFSLPINLPTFYAGFGEVEDVNQDGVPDVQVVVGSGSHGIYHAWVSVYADSLAFLLNENGHYFFFASGGGMQLKDHDGDGTPEIVLREMVWPGDTIHDPDNPPENVYRWDGEVYRLVE